MVQCISVPYQYLLALGNRYVVLSVIEKDLVPRFKSVDEGLLYLDTQKQKKKKQEFYLDFESIQRGHIAILSLDDRKF